ncbi:hypothetical protein EI969_18175 [Pseudomonas sp. PB101]|uniref:AAA family ATPase n=1 Tax=Pseudomonas sp. PB101 TaxID=2495428 RepID=UPI0013653554|nr:AAA family ATPase [Pseudomonas sp. PB101]MVW87846.1 hypothetical protein [Pseudomonas sp. PB101]
MQNSYIESLHVMNVRQFGELNVKFNDGFNFISGPNGCGKTSILACISHCFSPNNFEYSRFKGDAEFWTDFTSGHEKFRVGFSVGAFQGEVYRSSALRGWNPPPSGDGRKSLEVHNYRERSSNFCPLFLGANRSIKYKQISGMQREPEMAQKLDAYSKSSTRSLHGEHQQDIKQWFVNRYFMIEKEWATEERTNWEHMVSSLPKLGPFDSKFSYVKIGKDMEPIFSIYGEECYLEELSSGFQAVLSIIASIFEWVEGSRPDGERQVAIASGTVLIDELDLHLHPEWQFTLRDGLKSIFPNMQFIVTTHSPHLLASAQQGEVIVMPKISGRESYNLEASSKAFSGWNTDQILSEVMGVESLENKLYERLISKAFDLVEVGAIQELEVVVDELMSVSHPSDAIVTVLQAKLAALVAMNND